MCASGIRRFWPQFLIVAAVLLVWGRTVTYDFVWDDQSFVTELQSIRSLSNVPEMFYRRDAQSAVPAEFPLFRPLRTVQYALLFQLGGGEAPRAWLFHLNNLAWHCAAALLLFAVARRLMLALCREFDAQRITVFALIVALGFAINPVVSETVCWVKSLDDIMAALFVLASLHQLLSSETTRRQYWSAVAFFALAIYSKVSAGPFPLIAFLVFLIVRKMGWRAAVWRSAPFFAVAFVFAIHNHLVIGRSTQAAPLSGSYVQTLIDMLPVVPKYIRLLFGLPPFLIDYSYMKGGYALTSAPVLCGALLLAALAAASLLAVRNSRWHLAGLGLIWTGAFLIPVSNLLPMMQYMAERFLYLPLVGWMLAMGTVLWTLARSRVVIPVACAVIGLWAIVAWDRSAIWKDNLTLFVRSSQQGIRVERIEQNAVAAILRQPHMTNIFVPDPRDRKKPATIRPPANPADWQPVVATLLNAYELFPGEPNLLTALGVAHYYSGQAHRAASFFARVTQKTPEDLGAWMNLGRAASEAGEYPQAEMAYRAALKVQSGNIAALRGLARALSEQHKEDEAARVVHQLTLSSAQGQDGR